MKLLLVFPKSEGGYWGKVRHGKAGLVALGLPTVAALTPPGWEVAIHDARVAPLDYERKVDLVGITGYTAEIPSTYAIADEFRKRGVPVVLGGVHVSAMPEEALQHADAVVIGEAELVWERLLTDFESGSMQGVYHSDTPCTMLDMKIPRRDLLNSAMYTGFYTIQATRGCPYDCDYCAVTGVFGRKFRTRPVAEVLDEIRAFDARHFLFADDNICGQPAYAKELFRGLIPLKKKWGGQTSITFAKDDELLRLYAQSGGQYAFIGLETLSRNNLKDINKQWSKPEDYEEAIAKIHRAGINVIGSFILGLDNDDPSVFRRTLDFVLKTRIAAAQYHILTPFPGTRLYDGMHKHNRVSKRDWSKYHTSEVVFQPAGMTMEELQDGYNWIFRETYTLPNILKRVFRSLRGIPYRIAVNLSYRKKALQTPLASFGKPG
ncbi:MAG: radical SAM protein [Pseudomonadota bacterium]